MKTHHNNRRFFLRQAAFATLLWVFMPFFIPFNKKKIRILGKSIAYYQGGAGDPVVFFHGNPTSSYLWRNVIPYVEPYGTCIAPDLIGMGDSEKLLDTFRDRYTFQCHQAFLDKFLKKILHRRKVILVAHDWGGVLAIDWAKRNEYQVKGIAFMETFLEPLETGKTPDFAINWFKAFHSKELEEQVLQKNHFVEQVLLAGLPHLSEQDKETYRKPFKNAGEDRLPTLVWPRQVPTDGAPSDTHEVFLENMAFMAKTNIPKLFINAEPGGLIRTEAQRNIIRQWPNLTEAKVTGNHFIPEQCPDDIGKAVAAWLAKL
ncbi:MAG: haloalkane dehalogenase [Saprospiraceae bacterium]|nr:haloalkane dehalogenase [Saprospiraceae bacterium]